MKCISTRADSQTLAGGREFFFKALFKFFHPGSLPNPSGLQNFGYIQSRFSRDIGMKNNTMPSPVSMTGNSFIGFSVIIRNRFFKLGFREKRLLVTNN